MIDKASFIELKTKYPFLSELPEKLQDVISRELTPDLRILNIYKVSINGKKGCLLASEHKMIAYWMSKFLFRKLPTIQEFSYLQVNEMKSLNDKALYIHASADPKILDEDYEEGEFTFESSTDKDEISKIIMSNSSRLN